MQDEVKGLFEEFGEVLSFSVFSQRRAKDGRLLADALVEYKTFRFAALLLKFQSELNKKMIDCIILHER